MKHLIPHLAARAINSPLAIIPEKLELMLRIAGDRMSFDPSQLETLAEKVHADVPSRRRKAYQVSEEGIAVIPIQGTLLKKCAGLWASSGFSSYEGIQSQLAECMSDSAVRGVLLDIDSPGGETTGCFELSDYIFSLRDIKPVYACANDLAASAAYAIASACQRIFMTRMGCVGSIGVFCMHADQSGFDEQVGVKFQYIFAGDRKVDGNPHEALSTPAKKSLQSEIDRQYAVFTKTVARNRGVKQQKIIDTEAACFYPGNEMNDAIPLLADEVGSCEDAAAALAEKVTGIKTFSVGAIAPEGGGMPAIAPHKTATSDKPWDGPAAKGNLKNDGDEQYYSKAYAWKSADGDLATKAAYKFIHHEVAEGGEVGAANLKGCSSGIGALNGARGGTVIPKVDRKGVYSHLAKHLRDGDEEPPEFTGESYVSKKISLEHDGKTVYGTIADEARGVLFVTCEIDGKSTELMKSCSECSLSDEEEFAAATAAEKGETTMKNEKLALAAAKKSEEEKAKKAKEAEPEAEGPEEMAADEEDAEETEEAKPEKDKKATTSKKKSVKPVDEEDEPSEVDEEDDDEGEQPKEKAKKKAAIVGPTAADLRQIATLCTIAGHPALAADFIGKSFSVKQVQDHLVNLRAEASTAKPLSSHTGPGGVKAMAAMEAAASEQKRGSKVTKYQAYALALEANPELYDQYRAEKRADFSSGMGISAN